MRPIEELKHEVLDTLRAIAHIDELRDLLEDNEFRRDFGFTPLEAEQCLQRVLQKLKDSIVNG